MGRSHTRWLLRLTIVSALLCLPAAKDNITPGELVRDADSLISADGMYRLGFFTPAGSSNSRYLGIWFNTVPVLTVIWVANRDRPISHSTGGGVLSISGNGSLVLTDAKGTIYWSTGEVVGVVNPVARLLNTSNLVVTGASDGDSSYAWQSFDYPTDSVVSGMKLGWSRSTGKNRSATSWKSSDDPAPGEYTIAVDVRGDPQFFLMRGTARIWRSGPWMGERFTGVPEIAAYKTWFKVGFSNDDDEVGFWYDVVNRSVLSRLVVHPTGVAERLVWNENTQTWNRYWSAPKDPCDFWGTCGTFGVCDTSDSPFCRCMQGFVPRRPENWIYNEGTEGCVRRTPMDCRNGTDGFVKVAQAKLPDTSAAVVNYTMGLEDCRAACLRNCSCVAYASAVVAGSGDRGCIHWSGNVTDTRVNPSGGEDLFVRLAVADLGSSSTQAGRRRVAGITAAAAAVAVVLGLLVLGWIWWCLWKRRKSNTEGIMNRGNHEDLELPLFDFSTIAAATADFSAENKLGEGGFGPVFKGRMEDGQEVAVKRLARNSMQGLHEFKNEVVLIAKLQHRNLVRLLGCCIEGDEKMLVYEYLANKSLDTFLFDKEKTLVLDWKRRFHIINGIARGLLYLHQDSRFRIIHRDLKAGNILLDKEMNPKISDFGMARIFGGDQTEANTKRVVGTYGYMSPEYIKYGDFSIKSDVFSFGVLMLEIVSGRRNRSVYLSDPTLNLIGNAWSLWKAGNWMELVDESMADGFPVAEVLRCVNLALLCVQESPEGRPAMAWVVQMLGIDTTASMLPQPKQPGFMATRGPFDVSSSGSVNEVTMTVFQGR